MSTSHQNAAAPKVVAAWREPDGSIAIVSVAVERTYGARPDETLGPRAWQRIRSAIASCGIDLDGRDRRVLLEGTSHGLEDTVGQPTDLAVAVALLIDAGQLDPAIAEDAVVCARLAHDGTLIPVPIGLMSVARWAPEYEWRRAHLADLDVLRQADTGLELWGYDRLGQLVDAWRTGANDNAEEPGAASGGAR